MNWCYYFIDLQQKAIFSKSWGGPEKDRFFGFFGFFIFFLFFSKSFCFHGLSLLSSIFSLFSLLLFSSLFTLYGGSSSSSPSSSSSASSKNYSSSPSSLVCRHCLFSGVIIPCRRGHSTDLPPPNATCSHGSAPSSCTSPAAHESSSPPTINNAPLVRAERVLPARVPVATQGTARVILAAHVSPDTCAAAGSISTSYTSNSVMALFLVAEQTPALHHRTRNSLSPGGRHAHFMTAAVTGRWWGGRYGTLPLVRVHIFNL